MKYTYRKGNLTATAENMTDVLMLMELRRTEKRSRTQVLPKKRRKKRKNKKLCPHCMRAFKGLRMHIRTAHPDKI